MNFILHFFSCHRETREQTTPKSEPKKGMGMGLQLDSKKKSGGALSQMLKEENVPIESLESAASPSSSKQSDSAPPPQHQKYHFY